MMPPDAPSEPTWTDAEKVARLEKKRRQKELSALSSEWAALTRSWTESDQKSWDRLTKLCREVEEDALRQEGVPVKRIRELVRIEFAWWDPTADDFAVSPDLPDDIPAVPVVTSIKEGECKIPAFVRNLLWDHPLLVDEIEKSAPRDQRDRFCRLLERVESIADTHDLHDWEFIQYIAEQDGPDQLAAKCVMAEMNVRIALDSLHGMGFTDGLRTASEEAGDTDARPLWRISVLLNAAVELGRTLEHYSISQNSRVEATIRRMSEINPGRGASAEGEAVLKIIKAYIDEKGIAPTSKDLLNFLKAEKDSKSDARPMTVDHPLWSEALKNVSWSKFQSLVKSATRRL